MTGAPTDTVVSEERLREIVDGFTGLEVCADSDRLGPDETLAIARELLDRRTATPQSGGWPPKAPDQQSKVGWTISLEYLDKVRAEAAQACGYDATIEFTEQVLLIAERDHKTASATEAPADEEVEGVAVDCVRELRKHLRDSPVANIWLDTIVAALRRSTETDKPGVREALVDLIDAWDSADGRGGKFRGNVTKAVAAARLALSASPLTEEQPAAKFKRGDRVQKIKGSAWRGHVVGTYSTGLTPEGYNVESENEPGSVQLYPAAALETLPRSTTGGAK